MLSCLKKATQWVSMCRPWFQAVLLRLGISGLSSPGKCARSRVDGKGVGCMNPLFGQELEEVPVGGKLIKGVAETWG